MTLRGLARNNGLAGAPAAAAIVALAWVLGSPALAQSGGRVVDAQGHPLGDAVVQLWNAQGLVATRRSDPQGRFQFSLSEVLASRTILVRRIGFLPARAGVRGERPHLPAEVVLSRPQSLLLEPITLEEEPQSTCPSRYPPGDDARTIWSAIRSRYLPPDTSFVWARANLAMGIVSAAEVSRVDNLTVDSTALLAASRYYFRAETEKIREEGYAVPVSGIRPPRFDSWQYARLESLLVGHFIDPAFPTLNRLWTVETRPQGVTLAFCSNARRRPGIAGTLEVSADTALLSATWRFINTGDERAGGQVEFAAPDRLRTELQPLVALFWRKRVFDYFREWTEFTEWHRCSVEPGGRPCP
jgi:hypothetical protein